MTEEQKRERLTQLLRVARDINPNDLDMSAFRRAPITQPLKERAKMCLGGHAARDLWFRKRGLVLMSTPHGWTVAYRGDHGFAALERFFGLDAPTANILFAFGWWPTMHIDRADVISNIERIINGESALEYA